MREAGTIRERIFQALVQRYKADGEEALVKIDALIRGDVVPGHNDVTGDIDILLAKRNIERASNFMGHLFITQSTMTKRKKYSQ